jgi:hypothetical protein
LRRRIHEGGETEERLEENEEKDGNKYTMSVRRTKV